MKTINEIENAIERLCAAEVDELAAWMEQFRARRAMQPRNDSWLERARGVARPGVTTESLMALTRGEE